MNLNGNEVAVIEQALQEAINNGIDYQAIISYREVLSKLQRIPHSNQTLQVDAGELPLDGMRFDYDDNAQ
jgi:hypothetical protein